MVERIFISYRRDDSAGHAGRVFDRLKADFGGDVLFMDVDAIPLGANFVRVLRDEVAKCSVLLAIIGPGWLDAKDADGERRLDNTNDFVRVEIATALARDIPVIPILLEGARIPKPQALPADLQELSQRNGLDVRHASFHADIDKLVRGLRSVAAPKPIQRAPVSDPQPVAKPRVEDLDLPLLPDGTIGIMHEIDMPLVHGLLRPKTAKPAPLPSRVPSVDEAIAAAGKWTDEWAGEFSSNVMLFQKAHFIVCSEPSLFDLFVTSGTLVVGSAWRSEYGLSCVVLHGNCAVNDVLVEPDDMTFLGFKWRPEYADLSDAVCKKLGGKPLEKFIKHP